MAEIQIHSVNWVLCPNCDFRFYVGAEMLLVEQIQAHCPRCHSEFDVKTNLESVKKGFPGMW